MPLLYALLCFGRTNDIPKGDELFGGFLDIGIPWPMESPALSEKDKAAQRLCEFGERLPLFQPPEA